MTSSPGFVLTMASYYGTLAASRCLGRHGVPVIVVDADRFAAASWSRHVVRRERCPPVRPVGRFVDWLLSLGRRDPGHVLYATCDDLAWAFAERQEELRTVFRLLSPAFDDVVTLLDKRSLYAACSAVGVATPPTWFPAEQEVESVANEVTFPSIVKPRTQVRLTTMRKGLVVASRRDFFLSAYTAFAQDHRHDDALLESRPDLAQPMIQEFCQGDGGAVYSVSGFSDASRGLFVARASLKLEQWPRRVGVGIRFADAPVDPAAAERVRLLCEATRFVGVFEAEFVRRKGDLLLIDFNPRLFGQMGFDVARGLPSPWLVYLAALDDVPRLRAGVEAASHWCPPGPMQFANRTAMATVRAAERLVGKRVRGAFEGPDAQGLPARVVDAVWDGGDWIPGLLDGVAQIAGSVRHPRATLRAAKRGD